ncbi:DEAD/DEAH box helicase [Vibrio breoganii]|uniref:DEAD/DEAH box helicase family protein n=1 Tax=Vibrio breoganii TaxID=553239 RepID=UPI000C81491A|nr:DEAD/DEAH box helicase family protein [Vibrio breoganii]PMG94791.1 DEAD/DEAH box helicase [Vibrio breoganii]PMM10523.1 DEAD/DEAH box helicase [Vibrio breoganii]
MSKQKLILKEDLLTTGGDDPLLEQLLHAINHANEIDIAVSFIRESGLRLLLPALQEAIERSDNNDTFLKIRVLTSDYLGITDPVALRSLMALVSPKVEVKVFETQNHSFHMKSYIFVRSDSESTYYRGSAFIGSNNISKAALTNAHEWCLRFDYKAPAESFEATQFRKIRSEYDKIFNHSNGISLSDVWIDHYITRRINAPALSLVSPFDNEPEETYSPNSVQVEALEALSQTREIGNQKGLVVLGTGMGKTWLSAFDAMQCKAQRVLFVAHREEILTQALNTYTKLWPQKSSGYFNSIEKSVDKQMVFASVQTLGKETHLNSFARDHFDYIVVDEFHHASANTYLNILNYFEPKFLLGLTATPDRTDQADILSLCNNNLVFDRNLVHGIDNGILVPFHYFGIWDDTLDYQEIPWRNGKFDPSSLDAAFATHKRAQHIFKHWEKHQQSRTLAFCVSVAHADYMAEQFNAKYSKEGYKALSVHSQSKVRRNEALQQLSDGYIQVLFSVDLFNEGTDLPSIDTILMIRPTQSNIIFLQQLGRGLRLAPNKSHVAVLDFLGNHQSFLSRTDLFQLPEETLENQVREDEGEYTSEPSIAKGCYINFDPEVVSFWRELKSRFKHTSSEEFQLLESRLGHRPTATEFFHEGYDHTKARKQHGSWFSLVALHIEEQQIIDVIDKFNAFLLNAVQMTNMTKCFKPVLLEAFIELDGFNKPPTLEALAERSWYILKSYPALFANELSEKNKQLSPTDVDWVTYWKGNPIKAFTTKGKKESSASFTVENNLFKANIKASESDTRVLHVLVKELLDYRLAKYIKSKYPSHS